MFNRHRNKLAELEQSLKSQALFLGELKVTAAKAYDVGERRWDYINGEVKASQRLLSDGDKLIELSHVDAPNVKVSVSLKTVVQALADHLQLGYLPASDSEVVVLDGDTS